MITAEQRIKLKKYLRGDYIRDVLKKLAEKNIVSKNGNPYSDKMISHVFNGRYNNILIEEAIISVYIERKRQADKERRDLNNLLGIDNEDDSDDDS
jgi:hypothetical protein